MNDDWKNFLQAEQAGFDDFELQGFSLDMEADSRLCALSHLAVMSVGGEDAGTFLQGQVTCNINELTETKSSLCALCNPKGRVISTFLIIKTNTEFLIVLPAELLEKMLKHLRVYVLRSKVVLTDCSETLCLLGLSKSEPEAVGTLFSTAQQSTIRVNLGNREMLVARPEQAVMQWMILIAEGYRPTTLGFWRYLDIMAGLPWLTLETSEAFIPQMLNLDKLRGISFNKGCYTGQEVVARTHYLGKVRRAMLLAECETSNPPQPNAIIIDDNRIQESNNDGELSSGRVIQAVCQGTRCWMLVVITVSNVGQYRLRLTDWTKLNLLPK
jgi:hypothetical protein